MDKPLSLDDVEAMEVLAPMLLQIQPDSPINRLIVYAREADKKFEQIERTLRECVCKPGLGSHFHAGEAAQIAKTARLAREKK
jgi:hypothetical protein